MSGGRVYNRLVAAGFVAVPAAIGAAVADERPALGAFVGTAIFQGLLVGVVGSGWVGPARAATAAVVTTGVIGGGAALGAAVGGKHPVVGASVGAIASTLITYWAAEAIRGTIEGGKTPNGQISGVPCDALARVSAGAFP